MYIFVVIQNKICTNQSLICSNLVQPRIKNMFCFFKEFMWIYHMGFCFTRLQDNYSCTQQTNHLLEKKLHCVVKPNLTLHLVPFNPIYSKFTTNSVCFKYMTFWLYCLFCYFNLVSKYGWRARATERADLRAHRTTVCSKDNHPKSRDH